MPLGVLTQTSHLLLGDIKHKKPLSHPSPHPPALLPFLMVAPRHSLWMVWGCDTCQDVATCSLCVLLSLMVISLSWINPKSLEPLATCQNPTGMARCRGQDTVCSDSICGSEASLLYQPQEPQEPVVMGPDSCAQVPLGTTGFLFLMISTSSS